MSLESAPEDALPASHYLGDATNLLSVPPTGSDRLTHRIFRYPAKFHPPVVRALLDRYTEVGDWVLDPFCGSGTLQVEASVSGRAAVGVDVDPVAVAVAEAKSARYQLEEVRATFLRLQAEIATHRRSAEEYDSRKFVDISAAEYDTIVRREGLWVPDIPRLAHWFRRYVVIDLARILQVIESAEASRPIRALLLVTFASVIRGSSNADPVPVSGLEVTSHMKRRDAAGRVVDPFALLNSALNKVLKGVADYEGAHSSSDGPPIVTLLGDATQLPADFKARFDAVITSPPYHNAVDYYRRHQLEMFWLKQVVNQADRLELLPKYIGRHRVPAKHPLLGLEWEMGALACEWEKAIRQRDSQRADDFKVYIAGMHSSLMEMCRVSRPGARVVLVVGKSSWNGGQIPTDELFEELGRGRLVLEEVLSYPVKNRYMSYARRNGADIDQEFVLAFKRL